MKTLLRSVKASTKPSSFVLAFALVLALDIAKNKLGFHPSLSNSMHASEIETQRKSNCNFCTSAIALQSLVKTRLYKRFRF